MMFMAESEDALFSLQSAKSFLEEARQDLTLQRWRSTVANSQLAVEDAAKSVVCAVGLIGRVHEVDETLKDMISHGWFPSSVIPSVERLAQLAEAYGFQLHIQVIYGDEKARKTPWQLFGEKEAKNAVSSSEEAIQLSRSILLERGGHSRGVRRRCA